MKKKNKSIQKGCVFIAVGSSRWRGALQVRAKQFALARANALGTSFFRRTPSWRQRWRCPGLDEPGRARRRFLSQISARLALVNAASAVSVAEDLDEKATGQPLPGLRDRIRLLRAQLQQGFRMLPKVNSTPSSWALVALDENGTSIVIIICSIALTACPFHPFAVGSNTLDQTNLLSKSKTVNIRNFTLVISNM